MESNVALPQREFGLGIIGMGSFGQFAVRHFLRVPHTKLIAIAGTNREAARQIALEYGALYLEQVEDLVNHPKVDIVYIATPPFLHYEQSMLALNAGKHVICEKPLALTAEQGKALTDTARQRGLLMATNLMQRYNPLYDRVHYLIKQKLLGEMLHGHFENYASDEGLSAEHWFWNRSKSGGIFIEHGIHFFDMFGGWLGAGKVIAVQAIRRPGTQLEEQVNCTVLYGDADNAGVTVNFYHGFTQPACIDRQELRLLFERGDVTLHDWIPTRLTLRALVDEVTTRALMDLFPGARLEVSARYSGKERLMRGRHKNIDANQQIQLTIEMGEDKTQLYGELLRLMFQDQINSICHPEAHRKVTEENGYRSLLMALEADRLAHQ